MIFRTDRRDSRDGKHVSEDANMSKKQQKKFEDEIQKLKEEK